MKKFLKQIAILIPAVLIGYSTIRFFKIDSFALSIVFYLAVYIVVGLIVEMLWREGEKLFSKRK